MGNAREVNQRLVEIIERVKVDMEYVYDADALLDEKIVYLAANCERVLDFGKSARERSVFFAEGQVTTVDINEFDGYPDVLDDICDISQLEFGAWDGVVCLAVLEHVYSPQDAVDNIRRLLRPGGFVLVYVPYMWRYHAPRSLIYQDYYRFSRDALAYLFRDFQNVTVYPYRGRYSTILNMFGFWKYRVELICGHRLNRLVDYVLGSWGEADRGLSASGYYLWAKK